MKRAPRILLVVLVVVVSLSDRSPRAHARPVPIGRATEIPFGLPPGDPCASVACDAERSGHVAGVVPLETVPTRVARAVLDVNGVPGGSSLVSLGREIVVAPTLSGFVAARAGVAGPQLWALAVPRGGDAAARLPSGELLLTGEQGDLVVVDALTGSVRRHARLPGGPATGAPLVLPDGTIVLSLGSGELAALDPATLAVFAQLPLAVVTGPAVLLPGGGLALPASTAILVVELTGPRVRARCDVGALLQGRLAAGRDGTVWARTQAGELLAVDPVSCTARTATFERGSRAELRLPPPVVAPDGSARVPVSAPPATSAQPPQTSPASVLAAVAPSGRELWHRQVEGTITGLVVDDAGTTLLVTQWPGARGPGPLTIPPRGALVAIDASGVARWRVDLEDSPQMPPTLAADGSIVVAGAPPQRLALAFSTYRQ